MKTENFLFAFYFKIAFINKTFMKKNSLIMFLIIITLTCLMYSRPMFHFYTSLKALENQKFSDVSGGIEI